jgi:hypothetical protein
MVTRVVVGLAFPFAVRRVHAHLARPRFENEPVVIEILGDVIPPEDVTQKRPRGVSIVGVNQRMNGGNHVANLYRFVVAVWRAEKAECVPRETLLGNHR